MEQNTNLDYKQIVSVVSDCIADAPRPMGLGDPCFRGREWEYVKDCIDTGWVSSAGAYVDRFEKDLAVCCEVKHAVAVVNGTAALHVSLLLAGVERDDEVLLQALTFVATANAVAYCGAMPHFVDSESATLGISVDELEQYLGNISSVEDGLCRNRETGRVIRALIVMHTFGHPSDLDGLARVCKRFNIVLVEDAAEALGSRYRDRHVGSHGLLSALSFNGNKILTTGGGGAILTDNTDLAKRAKHLTTTAKLPHPWRFDHDAIGFNYRMPNINAALGCAQLEQLPVFIQSKRNLAARYRERLHGIKGLEVFVEQSFVRSNYWLNVILVDGDVTQRDTLIEAFHNEGLLVRPVWTLLNRLPMYANCPRAPLPVAESLEMRIINLPSGVVLDG